MMSNLGVLLWTTAAAVSLFTAALLHRMDPRREPTIFFLFSGLLGVMLTLDDLFTLHEGVLPGSLGIPEKVVYAGYFLSIAGYLVVFSRRILTTRFLLLALALSFFGGSILMDMLLTFSARQTFVEDAFKFVGIVFWTAYFLDTSFTAVRQASVLR